MLRKLKFRRCALPIYLLAMIVSGSCGPDQWVDPPMSDHIEVLVHVSGLSTQISSLHVNAALNGKPAQQPLDLTARLDLFVVELSKDATGTLSLDATAHDAQGCRVGGGHVQVALSYAPPYQIEATLTLSLLPAALCTLTVSKTGPGAISSLPAGLTCDTSSSQCSGEFAKGTRITLRNDDIKSTYQNWSGACSGTGSCTLDLQNASLPLSVDTFPRHCQAEFCVYNGLPDAGWITNMWGSAPDDLWATTRGSALLHYDGKYWRVVYVLPDDRAFVEVWGSGPRDVWATVSTGPAVHYDGTRFTLVDTGNVLYSLWGTSAQNIWGVGDGGAIMHYDGSTWNFEISSTTQQLRGVWGSSQNDIWAVGHNGTILRRQSGTWATAPESGTLTAYHLFGVWGSAQNDVWIAGGGTRLHFDGGAWTAAGAGSLNSVWGTAANDVWVAGENYLVQHYDGTSWVDQQLAPSATFTTQIFSVYGQSASDVWIFGFGGALLHKLGTQPFSVVNSFGIDDLRGIYGTSASNIWVVDGRSALRHFDGQSWTKQDLGFTNVPFRLFGFSDSDMWIVGRQVVAHYDGTRITQLTSSVTTQGDWYDVWGSAPNDIYIVGHQGKILHGSASGFTEQGSCGTTGFGVYGTSASDIWVTGEAGALCHGDGSGTWTMVSPRPTTQSLFSAFGTAPNNYWAVGASGTILRWNGTSWSADPQSGVISAMYLYSVVGLNANDIWAVGNDFIEGEILRWNGTRWSSNGATYKPALLRVLPLSAQDAWFFGSGGAVLRYQP